MIQTQYSPDIFAGTGAVTAYSFNWPLLAKTDLIAKTKVVATGVVATLSLDVDYTIPDADLGVEADGGTLTLAVALASGTNLYLIRRTALTQLVDFQEGGVFPSATVEEIADRLTLIAQELYYQIRQSLKFADTSSYVDVDVPDPADDTFLGWFGGTLINTSLGQIGDEVAVAEGDPTHTVVFLTAADDATYRVVTLTTNWNTTADWSLRTTAGFLVTFGTPAPAGAKLVWGIVP